MDSESSNTLPKGYKLHWYEIESILGRGSFGITYLAHDRNLEHRVAIKEYLPTQFAVRKDDFTVHALSGEKGETYKWGLKNFLKEARTLVKFSHPNIVRVLSVFEINNTAYMVMEYEQGDDLSKVMKKKGPFNQEQLLQIFLPLLDGLELVHKTGFVHRDIKPANIYLRADQTPVLLDFGSARQTVQNETKALTGLVTVGYAPFEQYNVGDEKQGPWTDIYALGATLYYCITGKRAIDAITRGANLLNSGVDAYKPLSDTTINGFDHSFLVAVDKALNFYAKDRPQTTAEWSAMLITKSDSPTLMQDGTLLPFKTVLPVQPTPTVGSQFTENGQPTTRGRRHDDWSHPNTSSTQQPTSHTNLDLQDESGGLLNKLLQRIKHNRGWVIGILIIVTYAAIVFSNFDFEFSKKAASPMETTPVDAQTQIVIKSHLARAKQLLDEDKYIQPLSDSALYHYRHVLEFDRKNSEALKGINEIIKYYANVARISYKKGDKIKTEESLNIIQSISPKNTLVAKIRAEMQPGKEGQITISQLLSSAKALREKNRLLTPSDENAYSIYQNILEIKPGNKVAIQGLQEVKQEYSSQIQRHVNKGEIAKAQNMIIELLSVDSSYVLIPEFQKNIKQVYKSLFDLYLQQSEIDKAQGILATLQKFYPNSEMVTQMQASISSSKESSRSNIGSINALATVFYNAIQAHDLAKIKEISVFSTGRKEFVEKLFTQYTQIKINLTEMNYVSPRSGAIANLYITQVVDKQGNSITPKTDTKLLIRIRKNENSAWKVYW